MYTGVWSCGKKIGAGKNWQIAPGYELPFRSPGHGPAPPDRYQMPWLTDIHLDPWMGPLEMKKNTAQKSKKASLTTRSHDVKLNTSFGS